jgi:cyclophilin family peptidyl-prolyl cis-trans isomerase
VAPIAVQSFIFLAQHRYFDGVPFHRVVPGFVIQGGDPTGTGACGPGYEFKDERVTLPYVRGVLAMANAGPNTNGSQFFIVLSNNTGLPPNYTIFGRVTRGMDAVDRITKIPLGNRDVGGQVEKSVPLVKVYMKMVRIKIS